MAYEPTVWSSGDTVTADKLNKIEQGIAGSGSGPLVVNITSSIVDEDMIYTLDKTWKEIWDAMPNVIIFINEDGGKKSSLVDSIYLDEGDYTVDFGSYLLTTETETGYPSGGRGK